MENEAAFLLQKMANTDSERVVAAMAGGETKAASSALADLDFHDILGRIIMVIAGLFMVS